MAAALYMRLNKPFYVVVNPEGTEVVWDWESPMQSQFKHEVVEMVKTQIAFAEQSSNGTRLACGHTAEWWRGCSIRRAMLTIAPLRGRVCA